jgi:hypothetical protein
MMERVGPKDLRLIEPEVIGCSWIDDRELVGRGRVAGVTFADAAKQLAASMHTLAASSLTTADRFKALGGIIALATEGQVHGSTVGDLNIRRDGRSG